MRRDEVGYWWRNAHFVFTNGRGMIEGKNSKFFAFWASANRLANEVNFLDEWRENV